MLSTSQSASQEMGLRGLVSYISLRPFRRVGVTYLKFKNDNCENDVHSCYLQ